ncbi:MAG TPA: hypothetical protein IAC93_07795, partial [Candidatus Limisoma gallistercoris]|nr:hypothetical protein [Candidatus Limisoma gallistercoris]
MRTNLFKTFLVTLLLAAVMPMAALCADKPLPAKSKPADNVIRVLAIGNSFSEDAVEQYLYELAAA